MPGSRSIQRALLQIFVSWSIIEIYELHFKTSLPKSAGSLPQKSKRQKRHRIVHMLTDCIAPFCIVPTFFFVF